MDEGVTDAGQVADWVLQWGHSSEAVDETVSPPLEIPPWGLQWGHSSEAVDEAGGGPPDRPGQRDFNGATAPEAVDEAMALHDWGERSTYFNGATARKLWMRSAFGWSVAFDIALQWGHSSEAVDEVVSVPTPTTFTYAFNGATARKLWMSCLTGTPAPNDRIPSMGPQLGSCG